MRQVNGSPANELTLVINVFDNIRMRGSETHDSNFSHSQ